MISALQCTCTIALCWLLTNSLQAFPIKNYRLVAMKNPLATSLFSFNHEGEGPRSLKESQSRNVKSGADLFLKALQSTIMVQALSKMSARAADRLVLPECDDGIIVLEKGDRTIIMIGTAHISEESVNVVRRTIRTMKPDIVMIELDSKRIGKVSAQELKDSGFILPRDPMPLSNDITSSVGSSSSSSMTTTASIYGSSEYTAVAQKANQNPFNSVVASFLSSVVSTTKKIGGAVLGKALGEFYNSVEKLGFTAGACS
jgi:hypothetical protein